MGSSGLVYGSPSSTWQLDALAMRTVNMSFLPVLIVVSIRCSIRKSEVTLEAAPSVHPGRTPSENGLQRLFCFLFVPKTSNCQVDEEAQPSVRSSRRSCATLSTLAPALVWSNRGSLFREGPEEAGLTRGFTTFSTILVQQAARMYQVPQA